jgi:DNA-directed RNA polymerase subunit RPC12/RpoP
MSAARSLPRAEIAFSCPRCGKEAVSGLDGRGRCRSCGDEPVLALSEDLRESRVVEACPACGSTLLYVQRDFNQKAGLAVVVVGAALAPFTPYYSSLMVAALIDAALYALLPEITVCYRCHAHFRGFVRNPRHQAFDLHVAEQYDVHPPTGS